jgi:hypothetical protein
MTTTAHTTKWTLFELTSTQKKMPKVFVTNYNGNYDYSIADSFGEVIFMTEGFLPEHRYVNVEKTFESYAKTAESTDLLFLSGSNIICAIAVAAWLRQKEEVHILQHGKTKNDARQLIPTCLEYHVSLKGPSNTE